MIISISNGGDAKKASYHNKFYTQDLKGEALAHTITSKVWSPIVWKTGKRKISNFSMASLIALDFDSGEWGLDDTIEFLTESKYRAIIGLTKSHQKEKVTPGGVVSPPCDRFRLLLAMEKPIVDSFRYREQMRYFETLMPVDPSCKDQGRYFFPCTKLIFWGGTEFYPGISEEYLMERKKIIEKSQMQSKANVEKYKEMGILPSSIIRAMKYGAPEGKRHTTTYRVAAELTKFGWSMDEIYSKLKDSPLIAIGDADMKHCISNGYHAVLEMGWHDQ